VSGYRLRPKAVADLEAIGDFIAVDNPARAVSLIDELRAVCARIAATPGRSSGGTTSRGGYGKPCTTAI